MAATPRVWPVLGWTFLLFVVLYIPVHYLGGPGTDKSYLLGSLLSVVNIFSSLFSIQWAFRRKVKIFYAVVLGGMALRFLVFAAAAWMVIAVLEWPLTGFLVSFIFFYIFLQYHEIRLLNAQLKHN